MIDFSKPSEQKLARDYDVNFFNMHKSWQREYEAIADILNRHLRFQSAVDLGCGNRYILTRLETLGKAPTLGIDGSPTTLKFDPRVKIMDLTHSIDVGKFDLAICTEVAEHIEEKYAEVLVDNIANSASNMIFFSAAQAGRGGHLHVNERPPKYWHKKFAQRDFIVDGLASEIIRGELSRRTQRVWWFAANSFVLVRQPCASPL